MKATAIAKFYFQWDILKTGRLPAEFQTLHCLEIFLLSFTIKIIFLYEVSVYHIPSCFSNLLHVKLLSPWLSQLFSHPHYKSLSKMLWMCILIYMFFTPFTFFPCICEGRNHLFMPGVVLDWVLKILFGLVFKTVTICSLNH